MLKIREDQYVEFQKLTQNGFIRQLADKLVLTGLDQTQAHSFAQYTFDAARRRGTVLAEDIEAFTEVLLAFGADREPAWCVEITSGQAARKSSRLRTCLATASRGTCND